MNPSAGTPARPIAVLVEREGLGDVLLKLPLLRAIARGFPEYPVWVDPEPPARHGRAAASVHAAPACGRERACQARQAVTRGRASTARASDVLLHLRYAQPDRRRLARAPHPRARKIFLLAAWVSAQQHKAAAPMGATRPHRRARAEPRTGGARGQGRRQRGARADAPGAAG